MILNIVVIVMLAATIIYSARLSRKLNVIRSHKDELAISLASFNSATESAIIAVEELQVKGEKVCRQIEEHIKKGQITADDIEFLIDRASKRMKDMEGKDAAGARQQKLGGYSEADLVKLLRQKQSQSIAG